MRPPFTSALTGALALACCLVASVDAHAAAITISTSPTANGSFTGDTFRADTGASTANLNRSELTARISAGTASVVESDGGSIDLGIGTSISSTGAGALTLHGTTTANRLSVATGGAQTYSGALDVTGSFAAVSSAGGDITITGEVSRDDADVTVSTSGTMTLGGPVSVNTFTTGSGTTKLNGGSVMTRAQQTYGGPLKLGANTGLSSLQGRVGFVSTVDGAFSLGISIGFGAQASFSAAVGATTPLTSVSTYPATPTLLNGPVTTTGAQSYGPVTLAAPTALTSTGSGALKFRTVDGAFGLTANTAGTTTFEGAIGGTTALTSLTTDAAGTTALNGGSVTTSGAQSFGDPVSLGAQTTLTSTGNGDLGFGSTVNGAFSLAANTGGTTTLGGAIGGTTALTGVSTDAAGTTALNGGSVTTSGAQSFGDPVSLGAQTTLTSTGNGDLGFGSTVNGAFSLAANTGGTTTLGGAIGDTTALTGVSTDAAGSTALNGGAVATTGGQSFGDPVTLGATATLTSTGNGSLGFGSTVNGAFSLAANTGGTTTLGGAIGGTTALTSLTTNAAGTTALNGGAVTTSGAQSFGDPVTLGATATLTSTGNGDLGFGSTVNGAFGLAANTGGTTTFGGAIGGSTPLSTLAADAPGSTSLGAAVTTSGDQTYAGPLALTGDATLTSSAGQAKANATVSLGSHALTVDGAGTLAGIVSGTGGLAKNGLGTLLVSADNTYGGTTTVSGGTLRVEGDNGPSAVSVPAGTLAGSGTLGTVTATGGTVSPGASPGVLHADDTSLDSASTLKVELAGSATTDYDQLDVTGPVSLGGATLDLSRSFSPAVGQSFTIVRNDGVDPVTGRFAGLADGAVVDLSGVLLTIDYAGGTGNDVTLTRVAAPTTTALTQTTSSGIEGDGVTFTATVAAAAGTPTGSVTFRDGGTDIGTVALAADGTAALTSTSLTAGDHSVTAVFGGDATSAASTSGVVTHHVDAKPVPPPPDPEPPAPDPAPPTPDPLPPVPEPAPPTPGPPTPGPTPKPGLTLTKVSATPSCLVPSGRKVSGAARDITVRFTLGDAARMTYTVQKQSKPKAKPRSSCPPKPGAGTRFSTVVARTVAAVRGSGTVRLSALTGGRRLAPGSYRLLLQGRRSDGSLSATVAVTFLVLTAPSR